MTLLVQDTFAQAKELGLTTGFVGTYAELFDCVADAVADEFYDDGAHEGLRWAEAKASAWFDFPGDRT